jgi:hypothetical protein
MTTSNNLPRNWPMPALSTEHKPDDYRYPNFTDPTHRHLTPDQWVVVYQQAHQAFTTDPRATGLLQLVEFEPPEKDPLRDDRLVLLFTWSHTLNQPVLLYSVRLLDCDKRLIKGILQQVA